MSLKININPYPVGDVPKGVARSFAVDVINTGSNAVKVTEVTPGCGACTSASLTNMNIKAGGISRLNVVFKSNGVGQNQNKVVNIKYMENDVLQTLLFTFSVNVI